MLTNHPFVSGRASRAAGLERLIARAREIDGLWIATAAEIAEHVETLDLEPVVHEPPVLPAQPGDRGGPAAADGPASIGPRVSRANRRSMTGAVDSSGSTAVDAVELRRRSPVDGAGDDEADDVGDVGAAEGGRRWADVRASGS